MKTISNFWQAQTFLNGKPSKRWNNNTYLIRLSPSTIAVRLHSTNVITYFRSGKIQVDSGGWETVTTKRRINQFLPGNIGVFQKDFTWFIRFDLSGKEIAFQDGLTLSESSINQELKFGETF